MKNYLILILIILSAVVSCNKKPTKSPDVPMAAKAPVQEATIVPQEMLTVDGPTVVDFYATWCGPCKQLAPLLDEMEARYAGRVKFQRIDVDEQPEVAQYFQIESIPTLLFIIPAGIVDASIGLVDSEQLVAMTESMLKIYQDSCTR